MILTLSCPDQPGIVARVSAFLFERGANILDAQQYDDQETGKFFMRVVFDAKGADVEAMRGEFDDLAKGFSMRWSLRDPMAVQIGLDPLDEGEVGQARGGVEGHERLEDLQRAGGQGLGRGHGRNLSPPAADLQAASLQP